MVKKIMIGFIALSLFAGLAFTAGSDKSDRAVAAEKLPFSDIENHWAKESILKAAESGLVDGFPDGTFKPDSVVSGDQFVSMMLRAFSDGGTNFDPEWMDALMNYQPAFWGTIRSVVKEKGFNFQNAKSGYWAKPNIDMLYDMNVLMTFDSVFPPTNERYKKQIKREEASYLLGSWFDKFENSFDSAYIDYTSANSGLVDMKDFTDSSVRIYRETVLLSGIIRGWNKHFYPQRYVTRAEALTMVQRLRDPALRDPYKPDLKGQYYTELDGQIFLYSDKFKYDSYKKIIDLANKHVTKGYVSVGNLGVTVFDSKNTYDKRDFLIRLGDFVNAPSSEFGLTVGEGDARYIKMIYPKDKKYPNSIAFVDAAFEFLAGSGKGADFKSNISSMENTLTTKPLEFSFNNKKFRVFTSGKFFRIELLY
ncbi:S-layer homology domain-containing protein [Paenibacillus alkaliterrae]|uniref:S-layer homology domain-containing protein n=1 Tax=Paenibacillus alkaliterrae TaxID=320909 RepID=UPI001F3FDCD2|nr:S-layer homology domain-containing protein [Paenibacillus alkaliterrae]MCF2937709.1 S-layer homology domain-containing protein [Paenibacillus alkaliterrae]